MTKIIQLISGPRNISTALMYSFGNRIDTVITDEPFYAYYLSNYNVDYHPGKEDILSSQDSNAENVINQIILAERDEKIFFIKNMAHHLKGFDYSYSLNIHNVFLIRDPAQLIASFSKVIDNPTLDDIGLKREYELYQEFKKGKFPSIVLDSGEVLKNPKSVLTQLCEHLKIPMDNAMLKWNAGPRKEDGVWAKYWYANVHKSTEFKRPSQQMTELNEDLRDLYKEALPYYKYLNKFSIKAQRDVTEV